jgi:hypothetical protein
MTLSRAIGEVIGGYATSFVVDNFLKSGLLPPEYVLLFCVLNMFATAAFILALPYWGTVYLIGWLFGLGIMLQTGLVGVLDAVVYFVAPLAVLVLRILKEVTS